MCCAISTLAVGMFCLRCWDDDDKNDESLPGLSIRWSIRLRIPVLNKVVALNGDAMPDVALALPCGDESFGESSALLEPSAGAVCLWIGDRIERELSIPSFSGSADECFVRFPFGFRLPSAGKASSPGVVAISPPSCERFMVAFDIMFYLVSLRYFLEFWPEIP